MANRRLIVMVVLAALLLSACASASEPAYYRFEDSDCPLSEPAKNLRVQTNKTTLAVFGTKTMDVVAHFTRSAPGKVLLKPDGATITFNVGSIVMDSRVGTFVERLYYRFDDDGILPVQIGPKNYMGPVLLTFPCLDNPGSENLQIVVGSDKLATLIAGLYWSYGIVSIREDGTVVVDRAGIKAKDKDGKGYTSVKNKQLNAYVMVKDK